MFNFSKVSSLALGLALVGGLLVRRAWQSANTSNTASNSQIQSLLAEGGFGPVATKSRGLKVA